MGLSRRALIKQAGAAVAALGLTDLVAELAPKMPGISARAEAYGQALAAPAGRKLALLIGINKYASGALSSEQAGRLTGCVTDVALQRELLIHRFGFLPEDIVCLTNEQATRTGIYQAFSRHLYDQAKAGDAVVLHFSGYGAQIRTGGQTLRSLVPFDGLLPSEASPALNDIAETELKTLLKQLKTKNITTVLDTGYVDLLVPLLGGLRSRARATIATGQPPDPFPLLQNARLAKAEASFPGVLLRASDLSDTVIERQWKSFSAGAFTYVLTQYLWSASAPVTINQVLGQSQETLLRWGGGNQEPLLGGVRSQQDKKLMAYGTPVTDGSRGEGAIQAVSSDGKSATLWLGGMPPRVLEYLAPPAIVTCQGRRLMLRSHDGLTAKARLIEAAGNSGAPLQVGQPVLEAVRVLPKSIDLVVALDSRLERIERVDATSALSALPFVSSTSDTNLPADCLLGKPVSTRPETLTASLSPVKFTKFTKFTQSEAQLRAQADTRSEEPAEVPFDELGSGYGLFSLTRSLIPGTLALQDEAIKPAINRLSAKLRSLMALKLLRLSENRASSQLPVRVVLDQVSPEEQRILSRQTLRPEQFQHSAKTDSHFIPELPVGSRIRYRIFNEGDQPLFYTLINVDPRERLSAFCPVMGLSAQTIQSMTSEAYNEEANSVIAAASILPGESVAIPSVGLDWSVEAPTGSVETYVVCSTSPLTHTFKTLLNAAAISGKQRVSPLPNPLEVVEALLSDLSKGDESDAYTLDVAQWATLNFTYQSM